MSEKNKTKEQTFADLFNKAVELLRNDTRANPSAERIVELCGVDVASARRVFDEIKKLGWVNRVEFCGGGEGYLYTEHFPAPDYDLGQLKLYKTLFDHKAGAMLVEFSKTGKDLCSPCIRVQVAYGRDMTALEYAQELQATANQMLKVETDNKRVCLDDALFEKDIYESEKTYLGQKGMSEDIAARLRHFGVEEDNLEECYERLRDVFFAK